MQTNEVLRWENIANLVTGKKNEKNQQGKCFSRTFGFICQLENEQTDE